MALISFITAVFFALITPGPGVLSTAGVGASYGSRSGLRYMAGLFIGNSAVFAAVALGMLAVLQTMPTLRFFLAIASLLYLLYLAAKIAFAGSELAFINPAKAPNFWDGVLLQFINPKAYAVNGFFISNFNLMPDNPALEILVKYLVINALWVPIHCIWLGMGLGLHRLQLPDRAHRIVNYSMALAMLIVVLLAATAVGKSW